MNLLGWLGGNWADALAITVAATALIISLLSAIRSSKDWKGRLLLQIRSDYADKEMAAALETIARWHDEQMMRARELWDAANHQEMTLWDSPDEPSIRLDRACRRVRSFFETVHQLRQRRYLPRRLFEIVRRSGGTEFLPVIYELEAAKRSASANRLKELREMIEAYGRKVYPQPPHRVRKFGG